MRTFILVIFSSKLPSVEISSLAGLGREDELWWHGPSQAPAEHSLVTQTTRNHLSQLSAAGVITSLTYEEPDVKGFSFTELIMD